MNATTRKKLFDALMEGVDGNENALHWLRERINSDIDSLVPVIDLVLREREAELLKPMNCGHPTALLELAPIEEQPTFRAELVETGVRVLDAKMIVYRCAGCRRHQEFVRKVVTHIAQMFGPCGSECSRPTAARVQAELASIT